MRLRIPASLLLSFSVTLSLAVATGCDAPEWGKNALIHPGRRASRGIPDGTESFEVDAGDGVSLKGWWAKGSTPKRGLVLWLHGVGDNKDSAESLIERWANRGFDVAAYDSRAHGSSGGTVCTYGFYEKSDVRKVLDGLAKSGADAEHTILMGFSMGAAVALQAAPLDSRIVAVVAVSPFADLRAAATRAAPFWMSKKSIESALERAEKEGQFQVDEVSPRRAAEKIHVPLLILHGTMDRKLLPADAQAIEAAAASTDKRLMLVDRANHDNILDRKEPWEAIDQFLDRVSRK